MPVIDSDARSTFSSLLGPANLGGGPSDVDIGEMSKQAASDFIERHVDPNDSIRKIAVARSLNPNAIDRVVEGTNLEIYHSLLKKASPDERAHIRFPLAKKAAVREAVSKDGAPTVHIKTAMEKTAAAMVTGDFSEYEQAPPNWLSTVGKEESFSKTASVLVQDAPAPPPPVKRAMAMFDKLASGEQNAQADIIGAVGRYESAKSGFQKVATQLLIEGDLEGVRQIHRDAKHMGLGKLARDLINEIKDKHAHDFPFEVKIGSAVDDDYLPDNFPGTIINGEQITLKLLRDVDNSHRDYCGRLRDIDIMDDTRRRMTTRVLNLSQ